MGEEVVDRGDVFNPSPEDLAADAARTAAAEADKAAKAAADLEVATGKPAADKSASDSNEVSDKQDQTAEERDRDEKGRFIPASRHKDVLENERVKREAVERQLIELQKQIQQQAVSRSEQELNAQINELRTAKAKATLDGDTDKIVSLEAQIDSIRDQISIQRSTELSERAKNEAREEVRMDSAIETLESTYAELRPGDEAFDQEKVDDVLGWQRVYMERDRMSPSAALVKAAQKVMVKPEEKAAPAEGLAAAKGKVTDRKVAATQKNIEAALKTPPDTSDVGLDTDKAGMKDGLPTPMSVADLAAIPEATLKRMRGDAL